MRLINADNLQFGWCGSEMCGKPCDNCNKRTISKEDVDNAPTVDAYTEDDVKTAIKEGHQVGYEMAKAKFERPHGEWIRHIDNLYPEDSTEECPFCHEEQRLVGNDDNFCPYCGAEMRKEEEV